MNDLPFKLFPPNHRDLEHAKQGDKFPAKPKAVDVEEKLQFYVHSFAKIENKTLESTHNVFCPNFGLKIEVDPQYGCAYVLDVDAKSSASKLFSSLKATQQSIHLSYISEIAGHHIFTKPEATTALSRIRDEGVCEFHIMFAIEPILTTKRRRRNANKLALFDP